MSDDYNISYTYQLSTAPAQPAPDAEAELFAFTNCASINMGDGSALLLNRDNGRQLPVAAEVATALTYCGSFKTLQGHAQTLVNTLPQLKGEVADVVKVLTMVRDAGMLLSATSVTDRLNDTTQTQPPLPATRVFVLTCDRPAAVERLLESMLLSGNLGVHDELFLIDDSRRPENGAENSELVANFNLRSAKRMNYVGASTQKHLLNQLIDSLPEHEAAIRFLIDRERWAEQASYGLARTMCLLLSVGYRCIVLDDDTLCRSVLPPVPEQGVSFGGGSNRQLTCFGSQDSLMRQASYADTDPLQGHASCLGMNLSQGLQALQGKSENSILQQKSLNDTNATMLNTLHADSPVLVTQCGSWGDPGVPGSSWFTHLGLPSIKEILGAPGGLGTTMQNRHYWLGRSHPNVSKMAVMSQATGLDNSHLLPPYFPVFRGEDYLFASMLLFIHPNSAVVDYGWSIPHLPLEPRSGGSVEKPAVSRGGLGLCARYLADRVDFTQGACPQTRLQQLALLLRQLAEHEPKGLLAIYREELAREHAGELMRLGSLLQKTTSLANPDWEHFLHEHQAAISSALRSPAQATDMPDASNVSDEASLMEDISAGLSEFACALSAWPAIRETARLASQKMLDSGEWIH